MAADRRISFLFIALLLLPAACTFVRIEDASGVHSRSYAGFRQNPPERSSGVTAYRSQIFGFGWGQRGLVLGWAREDAVHSDDLGRCRVIIFELPSDQAEAAKWRELVANRPDVCILDGGKHDAVQ